MAGLRSQRHAGWRKYEFAVDDGVADKLVRLRSDRHRQTLEALSNFEGYPYTSGEIGLGHNKCRILATNDESTGLARVPVNRFNVDLAR